MKLDLLKIEIVKKKPDNGNFLLHLIGDQLHSSHIFQPACNREEIAKCKITIACFKIETLSGVW